ncbi:7TM diverse intracellular signaling domain-containing protein [Vreelandella massiliensis]|uniref:7TM diverse intracellular signaling domain-containing protein n=1 Tax=Vreelandella massiliensis TaxID=1816686 RepID=UPI0009F9B8B3|nr:7TM diverse intracellular signaling domain-containing protein [Halomonas massiliensis]
MRVWRMQGWMLSIAMFLTLCLPGQSLAQTPLLLDGQQQAIELSSAVAYFRHSGEELSPQEALKRFQDPTHSATQLGERNFGLTRDTIWLHIPLRRLSDAGEPWYLEVGHASLDEVTLFQSVPGTTAWREEVSGDLLPFSSRSVAHLHHVFALAEHEAGDTSQDLLLRVRSEGTLTVPLTLWTQEALWQRDQHRYMLLGLYYGILLSLLIYNLFLYFALRDTLYITYSGYVFFLAIGQAGLSGVTGQFLFPNWGWLTHMTPTAGVSAAGIFGTLFVQRFLGSTPRRLHLGWLMPTLSVAYTLTLLTALFVSYNVAAIAVNLISLVFVVSAASMGIASLIRKEPGARFFVVAWLFFLLGVMVIALHNLGVLPSSFLIANAMMIGSAVEMLLLSLALADRIQNLQRQKQKAQAEAITNRQKLLENERIHKEELEQRVKKRTHDLEEANRLLHLSQKQLEHQATHDTLTGLKNRQYLHQRAQEALAYAERHQQHFALAVIDLDGFKPINDTHGHAAGDQMLAETAKRLCECVRTTDTVARIGGDEFVILYAPPLQPDDIPLLRDRVIACTTTPIEIDSDLSVALSLSVGVALYPSDGRTMDDLFTTADNAMYQHKLARKSQRR